MTDDEVIEAMAIEFCEGQSWAWALLDDAHRTLMKKGARAALAVAEPVIRERFAKLAESFVCRENWRGDFGEGYDTAAEEIAAAIRKDAGHD